MQLTHAFIASQICQRHTVHTVSGACGGPYDHAQHPQWVDACFDILAFGSKGVARGAALLETKTDL